VTTAALGNGQDNPLISNRQWVIAVSTDHLSPITNYPLPLQILDYLNIQKLAKEGRGGQDDQKQKAQGQQAPEIPTVV